MAQKIKTNFYGYIPTLWIVYTFLILFILTTAVHAIQAFYFKPRLYWLIPTIIVCGLGEITGWSGRLWSHQNIRNRSAFMLQLVTTIIAPTFLTAALYTILGDLSRKLGSQYSRLSPKAYIIIFVIADILALVVQSVGGAMAAGANGNQSKANFGANIMVGGIVFQIAAITVYVILGTELLLRFYFQKPLSSPPPKPVVLNGSTSSSENDLTHTEKMEGQRTVPSNVGLMVLGLCLATTFVYVRSIYRTIELLGGWDGRIITTEVYFNVLDATPIFLAMFILNVLHPGALLRERV